MGLFAWLRFLLFVRQRVNTPPADFATQCATGVDLDARALHPFDDLDRAARQYDYVICGGGTAGCVLANRLSADPACSVLVIEAGGSDQQHLMSAMPAGILQLMYNPETAFQFQTEPEPALDGRRIFWSRGRMLGGCSATNAMVHQKCHTEDWNEWASEHGCAGWAWDKVKPCFDRYERFVAPHVQPQRGTEHLDTQLSVDADGFAASLAYGYRERAHGRHGLVTTTPANPTAFGVSKNFVASCAAAGIPRMPDYNDDATPTFGAALAQRTISPDGYRVSTSTAYLPPDVIAARPNLTVGTYAQVTRILFARDADGTPRAAGVELADAAGNLYQVRAAREVLVCGGTVQSPHMLQLSGIGPRALLEAHSIPVVHELAGVGENLQDHLGLQIAYRVPFWDCPHYMKYLGPLPLIQWLWNQTGVCTTAALDSFAFFHNEHSAIRALTGRPSTVKETSAADAAADDAALARIPNLEILNIYGSPKTVPYQPWAALASYMVISLKPYSRGRISLSSRNPLAHPRIEARYLSDERDMAVMVDGVRAALGVNRHMAAAGHSYGMYELDQSGDGSGDGSGNGSGGPSDDEIRQFIRANAEAAFHPTSSCSMGPASNKLAVVDERLRVHGVRGLRVVDLSVVPTSPRGHTAAVAIAVGEMASDFIIQDRLRAAE